MKKIFLIVVMCIFTTLNSNSKGGDLIHFRKQLQQSIDNAPPPTMHPFLPGQTIQSGRRMASISDIDPYFQEAAIIGKWNLFNPPQDMAMQAYLDQKVGIGGGHWGVAIRSMFTINRNSEEGLVKAIPAYGASRKTIYRNPTTDPTSAHRFLEADFLAEKFANLGIFGGIILLLVGSLIVFVIWKLLKSKKKKIIDILKGITMKKTNFNKNEIVILSVVIGVLIALIFGGIFTEKYDVIDGIKVYGKRYNDYSEFNYLLAFCSLIIVSGISYLYLIRICNSRKDDNNIEDNNDLII